MNDINFMQEALRLAKKSFDEGEVPVGAVVVKNGEIVGTGRNRENYLPTVYARKINYGNMQIP